MTVTSSIGSGAVVEPNALLTDGTQLIGGEWVPAASGERIDVINPATGELLLRVPRSGPADVDAAVRAAADAFPAWRDTSPVVRADLLRRWAALCRERTRDIEILEQMEVGHPRWGPSPVPAVIEFPAGLADKITGQTLPTASPDVLGLTIREPFGVCGSIIPWNVPGPIMVTDVAPAIAVGNTIVVKPAEDAPLTCLLLARLALEAGIPPGVLNVVTGYGAEAGAALPAHPLVRRGRRGRDRRAQAGRVEVRPGVLRRADPLRPGHAGHADRPGGDLRAGALGAELLLRGRGGGDRQRVRYGLNACVWTSDVGRALRLARRIEAGQVTINGFGSRGVIGAPWGGYKHSGFGRTMSAESVLDYTQVKTVVINA